MKECTHCNADGGWFDLEGEWVMCDECDGRGYIVESDDHEQAGQLRLFNGY